MMINDISVGFHCFRRLNKLDRVKTLFLIAVLMLFAISISAQTTQQSEDTRLALLS